MATEKIEDVSTEILQKRKKFATFLLGLFIGIIIVWLGLIIYDFIKNGETSNSTIFGGLGSLACSWIPLYILNKINTELKRRRDN